MSKILLNKIGRQKFGVTHFIISQCLEYETSRKDKISGPELLLTPVSWLELHLNKFLRLS